MASVEEGLLSSPQLLNREEVPDVFQRAGFVSPGLRYLHLEKDCFPRRAVGQKISHFTESKCDLPISAQARLCPCSRTEVKTTVVIGSVLTALSPRETPFSSG